MAALSTNVAKTIALWFGSKTDTAVGVYYAVSCLGIVASQAVGELYDSVRQAYVIAEIALVAVTALWVIVDKNLPNGVNPPSEKPALNTFLVAAKNTNVWLIALAVGFTLSSSTAFAGLLLEKRLLYRQRNERIRCREHGSLGNHCKHFRMYRGTCTVRTS